MFTHQRSTTAWSGLGSDVADVALRAGQRGLSHLIARWLERSFSTAKGSRSERSGPSSASPTPLFVTASALPESHDGPKPVVPDSASRLLRALGMSEDDSAEISLPDSLPSPEEWDEMRADTTLTIEFGPMDVWLIQGAMMRISQDHAYHGCQIEECADGILEKINDGIEEQIDGR